MDTAAVHFPGFAHFVRPARRANPGSKKKTRLCGGLLTLVSSQLLSAFSVSRIDDIVFDGLECLCLRFDRLSTARADLPSSFVLFNFYVVAQPAQFDFNAFFFVLEATCLALGTPAVICGDFNAHLTSKGSTLPNARDRDFREFAVRMDDGGFAFFPHGDDLDRPTFLSDRGCTVIDYFFVRGVPCSGFKLSDLTDKGHRALELDLDWPNFSSTTLRPRTSHRRHLRSSPPDDFFNLFSGTYGLRSVTDFIRAGLCRLFTLFVLHLGSLLSVSRGSGVSSKEPWHRYLSAGELRPLMDLEREVSLLAAGVRVGALPSVYSTRVGELRRLRRSLHVLSTRRLFEDVQGSLDDPSRLWALVKKFRVSQEQGSLPVDTLVHHFQSVFNRTGDAVPFVFAEPGSVGDDVLDPCFSMEELESAFGQLARGTAPGTTGIGNDVLRSLFTVPGGPDFFLCLFNACLEGAELPSVWRCTEVFLLYKGKGLVTDPGSYRGIALMDSSLKLFERLLYARLAPWAARRDLIPDCQFGFRARAGTLDAVFVFLTLIWKYVTVKRSRLFVALIDFAKAFPSVNRALLVQKLGQLGVSSKFCRCLCAIFYRNTFVIRVGASVTPEFPVTTGLREGSVLSPLLFSLFVSDMTNEVLRPFEGFLQHDPLLNAVRIPGLLYADDLVLFCLTGDLLRERLRRLGDYAYRNQLTVNVSKCEVVVFGGGSSGHGAFRFNGQSIPVRTSCKYLGVWLDADRSGRTLRNALLEKFRAGVPTFFGLCRQMRIGDLPHVHRLARSLLFSLLYGAEFVQNIEDIRRCEQAWWKGVRQFYGLPNGVSNATLALLFPDFSLVHKVLLGKLSLMLRGLRSLPTLLPEALIFDRGFLFARHQMGFTQGLYEWGAELGFENFHLLVNKGSGAGLLCDLRGRTMDSHWDNFSWMSSTKAFANLIGSRFAFRQVAVEASRRSRLGLRVFLLAISGSLAQSYLKSRTCSFCQCRFDFEHFISCSALGEELFSVLQERVVAEDWKGVADLVISRFRVFIHLYRQGQCDGDENELFDSLDLD